jgi:hypothetical protein
MSRCEFSITLAASATLMDGARWVPAVITDWYNLFTLALFQAWNLKLPLIFYLLYVLYPWVYSLGRDIPQKINIEF